MTSAVNKRIYQRHAVTVSASAISPRGLTVDCTIRDFCEGGMFVTPHPAAGDDVPWSNGDSIIIDIPTADAADLRVFGRVARIVEDSLGIAFEQLDSAAFEFLMQQARAGAETGATKPPRAPKSADTAAIIAAYRQQAERLVEGLVERFITQAIASLDQSDELSKTNWRGIVDTQQKLRSKRPQLLDCYRAAVLEGLDRRHKQFKVAAAAAPSGGLSLIEHKDFQDWLNLTTLVSKLESHNEETLFGLEPRLGVVLQRQINRQTNPLGAHALVRQFQDCFDSLTLEESMQTLVFRAFENVALTEIGLFYQQLDKYLRESGILPELKKDFRVVRKTVPSRPQTPPPSTEPRPATTDPAEPSAAAPEFHAEPVYGSASPADNASGTTASNRSAGGAAAPSSASGSNAAIANVTAKAGRDIPAAAAASYPAGGEGPAASPYAAANELLQLERAALQTRQAVAQPKGDHVASSTGKTEHSAGVATAAPAEHYSAQELTSTLAQAQQQGISVHKLRQQGSNLSAYITETLAHQPGGSAKRLPAELHDKLNVTESLLSSIRNDAIVDAGLKEWFEEIELPFVQVALNNEPVLQDRDHPLHHLFNTLDQLYQLLPPDQLELRRQLAQKVKGALEGLNRADGGDTKALDEAVASIDKLYSEQSNEYKRRVDAVVAACRQEPNPRQQTLDMLQDIDRLFDVAGERMIPTVILLLMDAGWKNLLWRYFQREGIEGENYRSSRATIEQLLLRLLGRPAKGQKSDWANSKLVEEVSKVLERINKQDAGAINLVSELIAAIEQAKLDPGKIQRRRKGSMAQLLLESWEQEKAAMKPVELTKAEWNRWLDRAATMADGELISFKGDKEEPVQQKLVWSDRKWGRFVFVDREGNKGLDLRQEEIAAAMSKGRLLILEGWDRPLMDRATYTMLQSIQERLIEQTNHDSLTGLLNRRGFESALDALLVKARSDGSSNLLCYLDLDRFNVINVTCGHEAGDELVGNIAAIIRKTVGDDAMAARLGGDEFALILYSCDRNQGLQRATEIRRAINRLHFTCESKDFPIDASFGLAEVRPQTDSVRSLLTAVDSACFAAKEAGRGRIEFYDPENAAIKKRQGVMEWVGRISKLFDQGLIQLKCQKIASLKNAAERPRYEILLQVQNEQGEQVSLDQFVLSAEIYNRIVDIDRWVVNQVFAWMKAHRGKLNRIHSLAINLSVHSVQDEEFMNSLVERLEQAEVPSGQLCFEITETAAMNNLERATYFMRRLRQTGVQLALDGFGTGHSSYSYLKSLPVDYIKIDGSFIRNIGTNIFDYSVVKSIHEMAHAIGKRTIAEYIESEITLNKIRKIGVDFGEGYIIEKPRPLDNLLDGA